MKKRFLSVVLAIILVMAFFTVSVSAAEPTINASVSASSVGVGETVKITIKLSHPDSKLVGAYGNILVPSNFEYSSISANIGVANANKSSETEVKFLLDNDVAQKNITITLNFKATKAGNTGEFKVETTGETVDDAAKTTTSTLNVKVLDKAALPSNANASSIAISPASAGKLVPDFKPDITSYNVNVDYSVTEVLLSVVAQDNKAEISIEGSKNMKVGANTRTVVITAQNGTVKKYTINIYRAASTDTTTDPTPPTTDPTDNPYEIKVGDKTKYMVQSYDDIELPIGFSPALHTISGADVQVLKDVVSGKIVVYATDIDNKNGEYYLYNESDNTFSPFRYVNTTGYNLLVIDYVDKVPTLENYYYSVISVGDYTVNGFKYNDSDMSDFVIFYGENNEGERYFYCYDTKEKTMQRAAEFIKEFDAALERKEENSSVIARFMELELKNKIIIISGVVVVLILISLIIILIVRLVRNKSVNIESLEAAKEQEFMSGFGKKDYLFLDDDNSALDDNFEFKNEKK